MYIALVCLLGILAYTDPDNIINYNNWIDTTLFIYTPHQLILTLLREGVLSAE
jgi:hypothetical protein